MKKFLVLASVAAISLTAVLAPDAEARNRRSNTGAVAAGVIGGLAAGALIAGATGAYSSPSYGYVDPSYGHGAPVGYGYGAPAYGHPTYGYEVGPEEYGTTYTVPQYGYAPQSYFGYAEPPPTGRVVRGLRDGAPRSYGYSSPNAEYGQ